MERRSPTGIARERETSADNAAPCQRQAQNGAPVSDRHRGPQGRETPQRTTLTARAVQVQQVPSVPSVLISDPSVEITTFWSCSASPDFTYHSQRAPSGSVTQVSVFSA